MQKICSQCQTLFDITSAEQNFRQKISLVYKGKRYDIPDPMLCPPCREMRRMAFRNERNLFVRTCDFSGERIISMFPPETPFPVWKSTAWWSSEHEALKHGRSFDPTKKAFDQFAELQKVVPMIHAFKYADERQINSEYTNCVGDAKDCYLIFGAGRNERCYYSTYINDCYDCMDGFFLLKCTTCYECIDCELCHSLFFSQNCKECHDGSFLYDCRRCRNCIACVGLRQQEYHILNQSYSPKEYERFKTEILEDGKLREDMQKKYEELLLSTPRKYFCGDNIEKSSGNSLWDVKNCKQCFDTTRAEDCRYCTWFESGKDCMDVYAWGQAELCYQICGGGESMYHCAFTALSYGCKNSNYLLLCVYCKDCFLCIGLKNKQYCILNKQFSKEDYEKLVPRIIDHMTLLRPPSAGFEGRCAEWPAVRSSAKQSEGWGEFFPLELSPFQYQYSVANEYYPKFPRERNKPFKLIQQEIEFYKRNKLAPPTKNPDERHHERLMKRNPRKLWSRTCTKCHKPIQTSYSPERPEIVYCEPCYLKEVY